MHEFELIRKLCRDLPSNGTTRVGPGDDCAVLDLGLPGRQFLFKTDAVVEGVHFTMAAEPVRVGHKALARCLSDVAAMAGHPTHALVTVGLPPDRPASWIEAAYEGLGALARRYEVGVVGGETVSCPGAMFLSVALLGWVDPDHCILRSGTRPGDALFVSGELGGSLASGRHLDFEPRLAEAQWLAGRFDIHAMIDLSDGLAGDLPHLLRPGGLGAELLAEAVPVSRAARLAAKSGGRAPLAAALGDGEDFELLFAVTAADAVPVLDGWKARFPEVPISCIGKVVATPGLFVSDANGRRPLPGNGYVHFKGS